MTSITFQGCRLCPLSSILPASVTELNILDCHLADDMDQRPIAWPVGLTKLEVKRQPSIVDLSSLPTGMLELKIHGCPGITSLPRLPLLEKLTLQGAVTTNGVRINSLEQYWAAWKLAKNARSAVGY